MGAFQNSQGTLFFDGIIASYRGSQGHGMPFWDPQTSARENTRKHRPRNAPQFMCANFQSNSTKIGENTGLFYNKVNLKDTNSQLFRVSIETTFSGTCDFSTIHRITFFSQRNDTSKYLPWTIAPERIGYLFILFRGILYRRPRVFTRGPLRGGEERRSFE